MDKLHLDPIPQVIDPQSGLPIGPVMDNPESARHPERVALEGRWCRLEPLDAATHLDSLYRASTPADAAARFLYLGEPAPASDSDLRNWIDHVAALDDPLFFAVIDKRTGHTQGRQSLMRITPAQQCIEIGNIYWGPQIAGTAVATEANYLFARYVFEDLGYRRYEWKCNALNEPSRRAAIRFGFKYEGLFRRAVIVRGRTRDTAWYSMIDEEWPQLKAAYDTWLSPDNFDANGTQRSRLSELTAAALG